MATRSTQKKAEQARISSVAEMKKRAGGVMELPSGFTVRLKNPGGLKAFMTGGIIPNNLMHIIQESLNKGTAPKMDQFVKDGKIDEEMLQSMMIMMDGIALKTIVEPPIHPAPENEADRDDDLLYVDELPDDDKQFIFQWITGATKDLESFRSQHNIDVASVASVTSNVRKTQSTSGVKVR